MQTKSATEQFWNDKLDYLNKRPLLGKATSLLDMDWMKNILKNQEDPNIMSLKDKYNLPTNESVLLLFHFFRNLDKPGTVSTKNADIAAKVLVELKKFWERNNIPIQHDWWIKKSILGLNSKYLDILKHIKRETSTEIKKRSNFQSSLQKLFDIASPVAEQELQKDRVLGKKKAQEDSMFLESQRTDRVAKMVGQDKKYESSKLKSIQRKNE